MQSEKEQLAVVMERYGVEWEQKGTHNKHLGVLDFKKQEREKEVEKLDGQIEQKQVELKVLSDRISNYDKGLEDLSDLEVALDTSPNYQLPKPQGFMTAKAYRTKIAEPIVKKLKSLLKTVLARCFEGWDNYYRLNTTNRNLSQNNERLKNHNKQLTADNNRLRGEIKDYKLLRKVYGSKQIDGLLEQARQSKQRGTRFRNRENER